MRLGFRQRWSPRPRSSTSEAMAVERDRSQAELVQENHEPSSALFGVTVLLTALGVLVVAYADRAARDGSGSKEALFWGGIALIAVPAAARLCTIKPSRRERVWLLLAFALGLYLAKILYSPTRLAFSDEFVHLRSVQDDLHAGHLFSFNPLLPEAARYPGLGDVTSGLVRLSGLSISTAGYLIVGSARIVMMLSIFLSIERLARSTRVASLAALLYAANPNFLYWSAQFSYESLALPLVAFTLYLVIRRASLPEGRGLSLLAAGCVLAVVITHHLSSYFLAAVLVAWSAVVLWRRREELAWDEYSPAGLAALGVAAIVVWLATVAPITGQYLGSIASSTGVGVFNVLTGASTTRHLFTSGAEVAPAWERLLGIAAVGVTLLGILVAARLIWARRRALPLMLPLIGLSLLYPLLLPLRFVGTAAETANRSAEFLFLGLGAVLAVALLEPSRRARHDMKRQLAAACLSVIVVLGGVAVSWQYSERLPQGSSTRKVPYELSATAIGADRWAAAYLGRGHRFASDFLNHLGLATYGDQRPLWAPIDGASAWEILQPPKVDATVRDAIRGGKVEYVMLDRRLSLGIPAKGFYFDKGEPHAGELSKPISATTLAKFDSARGVSRLYDNGQQQIYDVRGLGG
jgi:Dolichyl-phosphate-mannose-protein mannosyltransferase